MPPKVVVWKELKQQHMLHNMWRGYCQGCGKRTQFWFFGATLGYMLEHIRRCEPFRYAWMLANRPVRPVSSPLPPADMSGQTREPEGTTPPVVPSVSSEDVCTCSPYFGCSEYAPDCPRHMARLDKRIAQGRGW